MIQKKKNNEIKVLKYSNNKIRENREERTFYYKLLQCFTLKKY